MRPQRLMEFVAETLGKADEVTSTETWQEGTERPYGVAVRFSSGAQLWLGVTVASPPGDDFSQPEVPVTGEPAAEVPVPELYENGRVTPATAERYIAAVLTNAGSAEVQRVYAYTESATSAFHPGVGLLFHSTGRGFLPFVYTAQSGQSRGSQAFKLQDAF